MSRFFTTYAAALEFLYNRINYERVQSTAYSAGDFKLNRMRGLLERLGNPQEHIPAVHIAGTKGKGSTAAMVASILTATGRKAGLFTSPHLERFEERMTVNGRMPSEAEIIDLVNRLLEPVAELDQQLGGMSPTYFEITTAMAWLYFRDQAAEIVVLEVGLGGRLDATNVCRPAVCVITSISRDHTHLLGYETDQIAREKAGIIKPGIPIISGVTVTPAREAIAEIAQQKGASLIQLGRDFEFTLDPEQVTSSVLGNITVRSATTEESWDAIAVPLLGEHQAHNTALAVMTASVLREQGWSISTDELRTGLGRVHWPARMEVVAQNPTVLIDAAHNWAAVQALIHGLDRHFPGRHRILVFAATQDKDVPGMLRLLLPAFGTVILTCYQSNPRAVPLEQLARMAQDACDAPFHQAPDPQFAWKIACQLACSEDLVCITGSFFIAAELRETILKESRGDGSGSLTL